MSFNQRCITVDGVALNVIDEGRGPAVLLVHGFPDDHRVWRKQIPALVAAGFRVIAPDMRGCGESDAPGRIAAYRIERLRDDLAAVLDALGLDQVALIGHDWGAVIGWHFAMYHPARVSRYAALSVGHPQMYATAGLGQKLKGWYVLMFQLRGFAEWLLSAHHWRVFRMLTQQPDEADHWIGRLQRPGRLSAALNYYRANLGIILPRRHPPVTQPVLGIWSSGDRFLSESQMRNSGRLVPQGWRYERVDGAGHWLQLQAPERINRLLLGFLKSKVYP